jgi:two-component system OmpR family sensor kinase
MWRPSEATRDSKRRDRRVANRLRQDLHGMTLRLRLVLALVTLVALGLAVFGVTTYTVYSRSQHQHLDDLIRGSEGLVERRLEGENQLGPGQGPGPGVPPVNIPGGTYAELLSSSGAVVNSFNESNGTAQPDLPSPLPPASRVPKLFTTGSTTGSGSFRVLMVKVPAPFGDGGNGPLGNPFRTNNQNSGGLGATTDNTLIMAAPLTDVTNALHRLVMDEAGGALVLLLLLSVGSWLILRRGLQPLERMAGTARSITAGDLSQRVSPSGGNSEVGQLGLALNTMLDDIEGAFREREETEQRLRQFLADASHELRTPLTSIQGFAELFRVSGDNARVDLPTILRRIEQESARMKVLVEDLLLLARLDQTRAAERAPVDLAVLAADACSDAVALDPDRPVTLDAPEPVVVAGDQGHLRQAIANLVSNAVRHTPPGTAIDVGAALVDGSAVVSVRDHGPGLDDDGLAHVFDRFWQADRARVGTGAGLGLAIVASIAGEHGGSATAANAPGGGAVFTLRLPLTGNRKGVTATTERAPRLA